MALNPNILGNHGIILHKKSEKKKKKKKNLPTLPIFLPCYPKYAYFGLHKLSICIR